MNDLHTKSIDFEIPLFIWQKFIALFLNDQCTTVLMRILHLEIRVPFKFLLLNRMRERSRIAAKLEKRNKTKIAPLKINVKSIAEDVFVSWEK